MKCEKMFLKPVGVEEDLREIDVLFSGDLVKYIQGVFAKLKSNFYDNPDQVVNIVLGGDKGGKSMKFHFEICHPDTSVTDVHIFCMFEGADNPDNMYKALGLFNTAFREMSDPNFRLGGHKVAFFLGGDFKYLDGILGTQGSSAKLPCAKCKVELEHLQGHGGLPHGPKHEKYPLRTLEEMEGHYNANLCETRGGKKGYLDLSSTGKHHESIRGRNLMKFIPLENVVPPVLHITLGIVLRLFNKLLSQCRILDGSPILTTLRANGRKSLVIWNKDKTPLGKWVGHTLT